MTHESTRLPETKGHILVTGMHRSGTSVVGRMLALMGAHFGPLEQAMPPTAANPKGYWERRDVNELNRALMSISGAAWDRVLPLESSDTSQPALEWSAEIASPLLSGLERHRPWFLKDPRFCFTLPYLLPLGINPVLVGVLRHPLEVAQSLLHRDALPLEVGLGLWEAYNLRLLHWMRTFPSILVMHSEITRDPIAAAKALLDSLLGIGVAPLREAPSTQLEAFYDSTLHRERTAGSGLPAHLKALWAALNDRSLPVELELSESSRSALQRHEARPLRDLRLKMMSRRTTPVSDKVIENNVERAEARGAVAMSELPSESSPAGLAALAARLDAFERKHADAALAAARQDIERRELQMLLTRVAEDAVARALAPQVGILSALLQDRLDSWQRELAEVLGHVIDGRLAETGTRAATVIAPEASPSSTSSQGIERVEEANDKSVLEARNSQLEAEIDRLATTLGESREQVERAKANAARKDDQIDALKKQVDQLGKKLAGIRKYASLLRGSARWRIGDKAVRLVEAAMLKRRRDTVLDEIERTVR